MPCCLRLLAIRVAPSTSLMLSSSYASARLRIDGKAAKGVLPGSATPRCPPRCAQSPSPCPQAGAGWHAIGLHGIGLSARRRKPATTLGHRGARTAVYERGGWPVDSIQVSADLHSNNRRLVKLANNLPRT